jgi:hypothetical protein
MDANIYEYWCVNGEEDARVDHTLQVCPRYGYSLVKGERCEDCSYCIRRQAVKEGE